MPTRFRDRFTGIIPPVVTPLTDTGVFDAASAEALYRFHLDAGVHGLFLFGSSGEGPLLPLTDFATALKIAVSVCDGNVPVLAGTLSAGTAEVVAQGRAAKDLGADAQVVCPPYYYNPSQQEVADHFRAVHAAVGLPIVAYDIPVFAKTKLALNTVLELAHDEVIVGVKDSSGDAAGFRRLLQKRPAEFRAHTGSELLVDEVLQLGADGAVPGLANVAPRPFVEVYDAWKAGQVDQAKSIQETLVRLFDVFTNDDGQVTMHTALGAMKSAMLIRGVIASNRLYPPFGEVPQYQVERVRGTLSELQLL